MAERTSAHRSTPALTRRRALAATLGVVLALATTSACKKESRCKNCGMRIDPQSQWRADLVGEDGTLTSFDTPRCALQSWRSGKTAAKTIRVQDYYDRKPREGAEVRFVIGGDVVGPMGPDLVPVDPPRVSKFIQDHGAERALRVEEVTTEVINAIK